MRAPTTSTGRRALAILLVLLYAGLIYGGSSGAAPAVITDLSVPDLVLHAAEYAVLGFLLSRLILHLSLRTSVLFLVFLPAAIATLYGATDEFHQSFVPGRDPSYSDLAADAAGALLGALAYRAVLLRHLRRTDRGAALAAVLVLLMASGGAVAGDSLGGNVDAAAGGITHEELLAHAEFLASPELLGRDSPSDGLDVAARYIAESLGRAGLVPAGADGGWFHPVPMHFRRDRHESFVRLLGVAPTEFRGEDVGVVRRSPDADGAGPLVFAGYGLVTPALGRDDYEGIDVEGKVVVVFAGTPGLSDPKSPFRRSRDRALAAQRSIAGKARVASERGAVALIAVDLRKVDRLRLTSGEALEGDVAKVSGGYRITLTGFDRRWLSPARIEKVVLTDGSELTPGRGGRTVEIASRREVRFIPHESVSSLERRVSALPKCDLGSGLRLDGKRPGGTLPFLVASKKVAEAVFKVGGKDMQKVLDELEKGAAAFSVPGRGAVVRVRTDLEEKTARNVVGRLPGRGESAETVLITAHYDHIGTSRHGDVFTGADDNASGTATMLAIAESLSVAGVRPERSILFVAFAAEEKGLVGSRAFVADPPLPLDDVLAVLNLDMMGRGVGDEVGIYCAPLGTDLLDIIKARQEEARLRPTYHVITPPMNAPPEADLKMPPNAGLFARSDQASFYPKRIPTAFFFGEIHEDYNRPTDSWDKLNLEKMTRVGRLVLRSACRIAEVGLERPAPESAR